MRWGSRLPPILLPLLLTAPAAADDATGATKRACIDASEQAQKLRKAGELRAATKALLACGDRACPDLVRDDCGHWMNEVRAAMPTVVLGARDRAGRDVPGVRVLIDGVEAKGALDGKPVEVDPGPRTFRFEHGGDEPVTLPVVVREGEKGRDVTASFRGTAPTRTSEVPPAPAASAAVPAVTWILLAAGALSLGGAVAADLSAFGEASCKPRCSDAEVSSIKVKTYAAGALAGVGVLFLGASAYFFFARPRATLAPAARAFAPALELRVSPGGGGAEIRGVF
jgi:hypothetical protein